ncbi:MAG TPA: MupA/Atu3671 family FMN-dependent luciferase-like monooxygenase [Pseudonocardiaceae bacterium]
MTDEAADRNDIAVIGIAGRFPGAADVAALWCNLRDGVESISRFHPDELESSVLLPPRLREHPAFVPAGGVLAGADRFDHEFFGVSRREARWMDPQQRVFLEVAWAALEDAGYAPGEVGEGASVYAGAGTNSHLVGLLGELGDDPAAQYEGLIAGSAAGLATKVSFQLGLQGESVTANTACSTGLAVVHLACQSLLSGQSRLALAGAVRIEVPQRTGYVYQDGMILSRDGHCRAFDHRASGTVAGNGAGVVVLKPLVDALADGDHVYAVIKGIALNNDGGRGAGFTAPSVAGQSDVIAEALAFAGVSAADIDYVEAHGTGTPLGDPIEITALTRAFRRTTDRVGDCLIGSAKTNLGHLDTAAGIAGLIKVVLMLRHGELVPSLHLERPNPAIDFAGGPFVVNTELRPWPRRPDRPRRAGVSSFGIGGTNLHAVLEEAPSPSPSGDSPRPHQLVTLSARTPAALTRMADELAAADLGASLADVAYTRAVGRVDFDHRRVHVVSTVDELVAALGPAEPVVAGEPRVVFLFPGQGSARHGMAARLHEAEPAFRAALEPCLAAVEPHLGRPLLPVLLDGDGPIEDVELSHAALFAMEVALTTLWQGWGIAPAALVGHSFGEYAAACVAGTLSLADAAALAMTRGRLVAGLPAGRMLAVGLGERELAAWLDGDLSLAAVNGRDRCTVSGPASAVTRLHERLTAAGVPVVPLPVDRAFHSPAVEPVLAELAEAAAQYPHRAPALPWLSTLTGEPVSTVSGDYWRAQLREPVRFAAVLERLAGTASTAEPLVLLEVGPGQALTAIAREHLGVRATVVPSLPAHRSAASAHRVLLDGLGALWCTGAPVDWQAFYRGERRRRVSLPAYPFEPTPVGVPAATSVNGAAPGEPEPVEAPAVTVPEREDGPRDGVERRVFEIWRERLGTDAFGVHDNFLELGGNSLTAAQLLTRLRGDFAVPIPLGALFEAPTVAGMADRIRALTGDVAPAVGQEAAADLPPIRPVPRGESVPLSVVQERTLTLEAADPGNPALVMPIAVAIDGELDRDALERAVTAVADRHETLRTTFHHEPGRGWSAHPQPAATVRLDHEEVDGEDAAQEIARAEPTRPFDLSVSPVRARLLRLAADRHVLLLTVHHVVCDTLSLVILVREITAAYRAGGATVTLPPLEIQYADFAAWQRQMLRGGTLDRQRAYWRELLTDAPPPLPLPTDRAAPVDEPPGTRGSQVDVRLPAELADRVTEFSRRMGVTPFVTILAAYVALLGRVTGADDVVVGTPVANRDRPELEPLVGYVAHALPLRADLGDDPRFGSLVRRLHRTLLDAHANPDLPYESLATAGTGRLFDAVLILHAGLPEQEQLPGATWRLWHVRDAPAMFGASLGALTLVLAESSDGFTGTMGYADELFEASTAATMFEQFRVLLDGAVERPETRVSALPCHRAPPVPAEPDEPGGHRFHLADAGLPRWVPAARRRHRAMQFSLSYFANDEEEMAGRKYRLLLEGARLADRRGFTAVWTPERHFHSFGGLYPSPAVVGAAIAAVTTRIGIRAGSVVLPLHDPIRVAEDWAVIDNLSDGRVGVSFASGWHPDDFVLAPNQFPQRRELLRDGIEQVRALWRGEPVRRTNGVGAEAEVAIRPRPVQAELPFWLTAAGSRETFRLAGELGAGILTNLMAQSLDDLGPKIELYRQAWRDAGHSAGGAGDGQVTLMLHAFLADDAETAYAMAREPLLRYFRSSVDITKGFAVAQGLAVRPEDLSEADVQALIEHGLERYVRDGGLFGTPQTCTEIVERVRGLGVDEVAALIDYGTPVEETLHSIRLLGRLVEQETKRAKAAATATATDTTARVRELARAIAARGADTVSGPAEALAWLAETAPDVLTGRTALVTDVDPPVAALRALHGVEVFVPAPELPDGSLPVRWALWCGDTARAIAPPPGTTVADAAGRPLGVGIVGELTIGAKPTGQRARWRSDGRLHLIPGPVAGPSPVPLAPAQQRIWSVEQLAPGNLAYNNAVGLRLHGPLDPGALHRALQEVVCRHEALRTTFHPGEDGRPVQVVHPSVEVDLPVQDATADQVAELARAHARRPFVLERVPLLRARLLRLSGTEHVLLISMHHIVSDGWSAGVLFGELGTLYAAFAQGRPSPLAPLPVQYTDYALAQQDDPDNAAGLEFWTRTLAGLPPLEVPADRPRPPVQGQDGGRVPVYVDREVTDALGELCRATGTTPFMVLYAALATLLHRHSGQADLAIGTAVAGRTTPETEALVGVFINTVVVRADLTGDPAFTELLTRTRRAVLDALAHSAVPFEQVVDTLDVPRDLSRAPLFQAILILHNTPMPRLELAGLTLEGLDIDPGVAKLDLNMELREEPDGVRGFLEYNADLFDRSTVQRLADQLATLLADAVRAPDRRLSELALEPAEVSG